MEKLKLVVVGLLIIAVVFSVVSLVIDISSEPGLNSTVSSSQISGSGQTGNINLVVKPSTGGHAS